MKYSELLQRPEVQTRLKQSFVDHLPSVIQDSELGDWSSDPRLLKDFIDKVVPGEIESRKNFAAHQEQMTELQTKLAPYKEKEQKVKAIRPVVASYLEGKFVKGYDKAETQLIDHVASKVVEQYGNQIGIGEDGELITGPVKASDSGLSELDRLLAQSRVTFLSVELSPQEMALRVIHDGGYSAMLK